MPTSPRFDRSIVERVAAEHALSVPELDARLAAHQSVVRENPGADSLVYEWRKYHPGDPLVARTDEWYVCAVRESVWAEFGGALDTDLTAVRAVHDRQARALVDGDADGRFDEGQAMVLARG